MGGPCPLLLLHLLLPHPKSERVSPSVTPGLIQLLLLIVLNWTESCSAYNLSFQALCPLPRWWSCYPAHGLQTPLTCSSVLRNAAIVCPFLAPHSPPYCTSFPGFSHQLLLPVWAGAVALPSGGVCLASAVVGSVWYRSRLWVPRWNWPSLFLSGFWSDENRRQAGIQRELGCLCMCITEMRWCV